MASPHTQIFIDKWHRIFAENDPALMWPLIHEDIEFYSPAIYRPKHGRQSVYETLALVFDILTDYRVTDTWVKDHEILFEFEAGVGKYVLQGIDRFQLNEEGKITHMKVWLRPLTGLKELARIIAAKELERHLSSKSGYQKAIARAQIRTGKLIISLKEGLK